MTIETTIPFSGFYNSLWSSELDHCETSQIEIWMEEEEYPGLEADQLQEVLMDRIDYKQACLGVAKAYVSRFEDWINEELGIGISLEFSTMTSPREYNFTTDRIFVRISRDDLAQVYKAVGRQRVRDKAEEMFTSRSGFISFYSPRIEEWGPIREWDYNQVGTIFEAAVDMVDSSEGYDLSVYYRMNEDIYTAWSNALDWPAVERDLEELMLVEEGEIEADARLFPHPSVTDTKQYIAEFEELNNLKGA